MELENWSIKDGIVLGIMSGATGLVMGAFAPAPELEPIVYTLAGGLGIIGLTRGIKNEFPDFLKIKNANIRRHSNNPLNELAQRAPNSTSRLLERDNERRIYENGLEYGLGISQEYLDRLSPIEVSKIKKIRINPKQRRFFGIPYGRKSLEVEFGR